MTTATASATASTPVGDWLLPTPTETRIRLEKVVVDPKATDAARARPLRTLNAVGRRALVEEVEARLRTILGERIVDVLVGGWRTHTSVEEAKAKSRNQPGVNQIVSLTSHTITARREHSLDVEVDSARVMTLTCQLVVKTQLYDAVAVVKDGHLIGVRSGQANADATITVEGVQIAQRTMTFPLTAELVLPAPKNVD